MTTTLDPAGISLPSDVAEAVALERPEVLVVKGGGRDSLGAPEILIEVVVDGPRDARTLEGTTGTRSWGGRSARGSLQ
jgi:hypothetical protein